MSWTHRFIVLVPDANWTEGRFAGTIDRLMKLPNNDLTRVRASDPGAPLTSIKDYPMAMVEELEIQFAPDIEPMTGQGPGDWLPKGLHCIEFSLPNYDIDEHPEAQDLAFEMLMRLFTGMGALYGLGTCEFSFEKTEGETVSYVNGLRKVEGGIHILAPRLIEGLDERHFPVLRKAGRSEEGVWFKFYDDGVFGLLDESGPILPLLDAVWSRFGLLQAPGVAPFMGGL